MSEGRDGKGWRSFASELRSVVQFFSVTIWCPGTGKSQMVLVLKPQAEVGRNRSLADVLVGPRKIPAMSSSLKGLSGNFDVSTPKGQAAAGLSTSRLAFGDEEDPNFHWGSQLKQGTFG